MNIFILDTDPVLAAQMQCDKHVVKMTLETTQLLSSALWLNGGQGPYRLTHKGHPCTKWAAANRENFLWLVEHGKALAKEYTFRYGKEHKCESILTTLSACAKMIPQGQITDFVKAMPDEYKSSNIVDSYRSYYLGEKRNIAKWTKRQSPSWFI